MHTCYAGYKVMDMTFGEKRKALRIKEEYSQEQIADLLHVSRQAVTEWENKGGSRMIGLPTFGAGLIG